MLRTKLFLTAAIVFLLLCFSFGAVFAVQAAETPTCVKLEFTGDEAEVAGFAQCDITVVPGDGCALSGYYLIYYTDGERLLAGYDEVTAIAINDGYAVKGSVSDGHMIPVGAKGIAVFESATRFLDTAPDISEAVATAAIPAAKQTPALGEPELSFGVLSDTHMNYESYNRGAYAKLRASMNFFAREGMSLVVIAGDATGDRGENPDLEAQYNKHIEIINRSNFDIGKVYEAIGNHGNTPADAALLNQYLGGDDEVHPFEDSPYFSLYLPGKDGARNTLFIFMAQEIRSAGDSASYDNFSKEQIDWLESLLTAYDDGDTNIFILEHAPFLRFGAGDIKGGSYSACVAFRDDFPQNMRLKGLLEQHKDAVVLSGHTHVTFYDDANYSDESNSFARTVHVGSNCQPCGYGGGSVLVRSTDGRHNVTPTYGSEGYTVRVYRDYIVFTGYNFSTGHIIPAACLLLPVKAFGGPGKPERPVPRPEEAFEGSGTVEDPYLIANAEDFILLTNGFNASTSSAQADMYGSGKHFLQTADIDMTLVSGYAGTSANGDAKCYFAGIYNGGGHTLTVNINDNVQRSVFPYVYGAIVNLKIQGRIVSEASAQPVRTLYGAVVNCIFELDLKAERTNGGYYSHYGTTYNLYTVGSLTGGHPFAVTGNASSKNFANVYQFRTANGAAVDDPESVRSDDADAIVAAFNARSGSAYEAALALLDGEQLIPVYNDGGVPAFESSGDDNAFVFGDVNGDGQINANDALLILRHAVGKEKLSGDALRAADVTGKGDPNAVDALYVLQKAVGKLPYFPVERITPSGE